MAIRLKSFEFRREREAEWTELEDLLARIDAKGIGSLGAADLTRLPVLYRAALSSLSVARAISLDRNVLAYLESLTARAYLRVYATKQGAGAAMALFLRETFPRTVRQLRWPLALSALFLLLGTAAGFFLTAADPDRFYSFVSEEFAQGRTPAATTEDLREALYAEGAAGGRLGAFASFLFTHNARVGMLAFALGFAAGVPVFFLLFTNGLTLGAFAALHHSRGLAVDFWGWILPHGVTELGAIVLCGAAGLAVGRAVVFPGRRARIEALARAGRRAGLVVLGTILLFLVAGLVEGFFRQLVTDVTARYAVALTTAALWPLYFVRSGRTRT